MKFKDIISAMRLRTIPLSISGVILAVFLASGDFYVKWEVIVFLLLTTILLQVLSNVCNELGDYLHGVVSAQGREASKALAEGSMSEKSLSTMIYAILGLTLASGLAMIWFSFGSLFKMESLLLMVLGFFAIKAAMHYTLGNNPYGYRGLGDLYVFLFFGCVSVLGAYFVCTHTFGSYKMFLPAVSIGFFSMGVLNVNNTRDMESDRGTRKTIPLMIGETGAKIYQTVLIVLGLGSICAFFLLTYPDWRHWVFLITLPMFIVHLYKVWTLSGKALDAQVPFLAISTFLLSILAGAGYYFCIL